MLNQILPSTAVYNNKDRRSRIYIILFILAALCIYGFLGFYLLEIVPHYLVLPMPPPEDSYNLVGWASTTQSVLTTSSNLGILPIRVFIWRRDATLAYESGSDIPTWDKLEMYFTKQFSQQGWKQSDGSIPCNIYLPEAAFLKYGKNGFVSYHKISDITSSDEIPEGDAICLAIWNDEGYPNVFRVVLLTVKQSFITKIYNIFH